MAAAGIDNSASPSMWSIWAAPDAYTRAALRVRGVSLSCCQVVLGGLGHGFWLGWLVGGLGLEHGEDDVAAASGDADDCGVVAFAFGSFALVVGAGVGVVLGGDERRGEHGVLEAVVAASGYAGRRAAP